MTIKTQETNAIRDWTLATEQELLEGYQLMAADREREAEVLEWSEALIGDGFKPR